MSGESSKRSSLIDVTYQQLHSILNGQPEGTTTEQISDLLKPRLKQLRNFAEPFGKPSDASRKRINSGSITLRDSIILRIEEADKECIFAISKKFEVDEVEALVLLRSFFYNEGLPPDVGSNPNVTFVDELLEAITPFYFSERLSVLRVLIPLLRAHGNPGDPIHEVAIEFVPEVLSDGYVFAEGLVAEYVHETQARLGDSKTVDHRTASRWAKHNARVQLIMLEVLFWTMMTYVSCEGSLVVRIFEAAYDTNLGTTQQNSALMLDEEGTQLLEDGAAIWTLITIEVLELERMAEPGLLEISSDPKDKEVYTAFPESLKRIHEIVTSNTSSQYVCTYLAWTFVLTRLAATAQGLKEIPDGYRELITSLFTSGRSYGKDGDPLHVLMFKTCLKPDVGLFRRLLALLTASPVFVTAVAWKTGSNITDPNAIAFRSVLKGFIIAIVELAPVELIPDFPSFVEVWIALFGRSESRSIAAICRQFWESDRARGFARGAILDVTRTQFPIRPKPLIRLLRAMTAFGYMDTDPLATGDHVEANEDLSDERRYCASEVFLYFQKLSSFTQVVPSSACTGAHALYEKIPERYGSSGSVGLGYTNHRSIKLPGGSVLPAKSVGRLLSPEGGDEIIIAWQHEHSGWRLLMEYLTSYVYQKRLSSGSNANYKDVTFGRRGAALPVILRLQDIGMESDPGDEEAIVTDALDLIRSVVQDNPPLAQELLDSLEGGDSVVAHTMTEAQPPDLIQLTTMILEEALSRSADHIRRRHGRELIISAMSVLAALLPLPMYSHRVWLFLRSTSSLFGSKATTGGVSNVLATERVTGNYTMTLALLHLVQQLFREASSSMLTVLPHNARLQQIKEEVLERMAQFVHEKIWREYSGWKYARIGDRFEIGKRVASFYIEVLEHSPPSLTGAPFSGLSRDVINVLLFEASASTINPLISSITEAGTILDQLYASRRYNDSRRLIFMLELHLRLMRMTLNYKQKAAASAGLCLLERVLCGKGVGHKSDPIDTLVTCVKERRMGSIVPLEAIRVLFALCGSFASSQSSPPTIVGHMSNPESDVVSLIRIVQHPYDELYLRIAVWNFICIAVEKEPALGGLFVIGSFRVPDFKGKGRVPEGKKIESNDTVSTAVESKSRSAMEAACGMLGRWKELWELKPQLLVSVLQFLDTVWLHGIEHRAVLQSVRQDSGFWDKLVSIVLEELGPVPDYRSDAYVDLDGARHSHLHEAVSTHAYRTMAKAHTLQIVASDIHMRSQLDETARHVDKPLSYKALENMLKDEDQLTDYVAEAASSSYDPSLHDEISEQIKVEFPALVLEQLRCQDPDTEREFGDGFAFSTSLLQLRLHPLRSGGDPEMELQADELEHKLSSINMNLSLTHAQSALSLSWQLLLREVVPFLRSETSVRPTLLALAASISENVAVEKRSGELMSAIHSGRLGLILSLLEVAWFSSSDSKEEIEQFVTVVRNVHHIILNRPQSPMQSFLGSVAVPFHRILLQIIYFCVRHSRNLMGRPKALNASQRIPISSMVEATQAFDIDALRIVFDLARSRISTEIDQDLELLIAVFEQCTNPDVSPSSIFWLTRCQETNVIRASLELFAQMDIVGVSDVPALRTRRRALYADRVLHFHLSLAGIPSAAERLATEGLLVAYSNNRISEAISRGLIDVVIPELPGERSPAHQAYCMMLSIVASIFESLDSRSHHFDLEACAFLQVSGAQIAKALSWTIGDPLTLPLIEEMEQTVNLFYAIAESAPYGVNRNETVQKVLRAFTSSSLLLLQQLNYALTHPNHLASLLDPVTADERQQLEKDARSSSVHSSESLNPTQRPFLTSIVHKLFRLTSMILSTLISISGAESVLLSDQEDWPLQEAFIFPLSKVVLDERASLGTLLELGNCTLDVLRLLSSHPPGQAIAPSSTSTFAKPLDVREAVRTARRNLEEVLVYAVTQLVMWSAKPEFESGDVDIVVDDAQLPSEVNDWHSSPKQHKEERRASGRKSLGTSTSVRRGMMGEVASDLQVLLEKAKEVIGRSGEPSGGVDLVPILERFLNARVLAA